MEKNDGERHPFAGARPLFRTVRARATLAQPSPASGRGLFGGAGYLVVGRGALVPLLAAPGVALVTVPPVPIVPGARPVFD